MSAVTDKCLASNTEEDPVELDQTREFARTIWEIRKPDLQRGQHHLVEFRNWIGETREVIFNLLVNFENEWMRICLEIGFE